MYFMTLIWRISWNIYNVYCSLWLFFWTLFKKKRLWHYTWSQKSPIWLKGQGYQESQRSYGNCERWIIKMVRNYRFLILLFCSIVNNSVYIVKMWILSYSDYQRVHSFLFFSLGFRRIYCIKKMSGSKWNDTKAQRAVEIRSGYYAALKPPQCHSR